MEEALDRLLRWLPVAMLVVQGLMAWALWSLKQQFVTRREFDRCKAGCVDLADKLEGKVEGIGGHLHTLLPRSELSDLSAKIDILIEKTAHVEGRMAGVSRAVDLLNQHHLQGSK